MKVGICMSFISCWFVYMTFNLLAVKNQNSKYQLLFSAVNSVILPQEKCSPTRANSISPFIESKNPLGWKRPLRSVA